MYKISSSFSLSLSFTWSNNRSRSRNVVATTMEGPKDLEKEIRIDGVSIKSDIIFMLPRSRNNAPGSRR